MGNIPLIYRFCDMEIVNYQCNLKKVFVVLSLHKLVLKFLLEIIAHLSGFLIFVI